MVENKIIEVFKSSGMSRAEFADKLQISNAVLSHLASGRNKASLDLVISILNYFPEISADWLLLNKGEMKRSDYNNKNLKETLHGYIKIIKEMNISSGNYLGQIEDELNLLK